MEIGKRKKHLYFFACIRLATFAGKAGGTGANDALREGERAAGRRDFFTLASAFFKTPLVQQKLLVYRGAAGHGV